MNLSRLLCCVLLLISPVSFAASKSELIDHFIDKTGMADMVATYPEQIQAQMDDDASTPSEQAIQKRVLTSLLGAYSEEQSVNYLRAYIHEHTTEAELTQMLNWLNSDLGQAIVAAELETTTEAGQQKLMAYIGQFEENPPAPARMEQVKQLLMSSHMLELAINMLNQTVVGVSKSFNLARPEAERLSDTEMDIYIAELQSHLAEQVLPILQQQIVLTCFFTYQSFSDEQMQQYVAFIGSDIGQRYTMLSYAVVHAFTETLADGMAQLQATYLRAVQI